MRIVVNPLSGEKAKANWLPYSALYVPVKHLISFLEYLAKSTQLNDLVPQLFLEFESPHCISIRSISPFPPLLFSLSPPPPAFSLPFPFSSFSWKLQSKTKVGDSGDSSLPGSLPAHSMDDVHNIWLFPSYAVFQYYCSRRFSPQTLLYTPPTVESYSTAHLSFLLHCTEK